MSGSDDSGERDSRGSDGGRRESDGDRRGDGGEDVVVERLDPEEAFSLVAHETRFRTLGALNRADAPLAFEELRDRVGAEDPGGFNYHLGKLTDRFVRKVDPGDAGEVVGGGSGRDAGGYELTPAGRRVVGAVLSGGYTKGLEGEPIPMDDECLNCGAPMVTRFRTEGVEITCPDCGLDYTHADLSPGILEGRDTASAPEVIERYLSRNHVSGDYGFCPNCDGRMDRSLRVDPAVEDPDAEVEDDAGMVADVRYECHRCDRRWHSMVPMALLSHPAVMGFHYDHGIDLRETPSWELPWLEAGVTEVAGTDPLRARVTMELDGDRLVLVVDESVAVVEDRRE